MIERPALRDQLQSINPALHLGKAFRDERPCADNAFDSICLKAHLTAMPWEVEFHPEFAAEFVELPQTIQHEILAHAIALREFGPTLGRPLVDTLKGSKLANLKELRFKAAGGVWRIAFIFDERRVGLLLAGGDKRGSNEKRFYDALIKLAEERT